jgi:hypothetical protein
VYGSGVLPAKAEQLALCEPWISMQYFFTGYKQNAVPAHDDLRL